MNKSWCLLTEKKGIQIEVQQQTQKDLGYSFMVEPCLACSKVPTLIPSTEEVASVINVNYIRVHRWNKSLLATQ